MQMGTSKRYIFQGVATGVAGQLVHPFHDIIPIQAASALTADGGVGSSRVDGFRHREILTFSSAHTEVVGRETDDGKFVTTALSVVENFNLLNMVTCDRIVGRLTGVFPAERKDTTDQPPEIAIVPSGSRFEGLRIGNAYFKQLEIAPKFFCDPENACWTGLLRGIQKEGDRLATLPGADNVAVPLPKDGRTPDLLGFYIALNNSSGGDLERPLHFDLPDFGRVHLAEFFCDPTSRRLIMIRAELNGGTVQGLVNVCDPYVGGQPYPP